jgi:hypothetical protein
MQDMKSRDFSQQFEAKTKQRDQHHKEILLKQRETIAMIKIQQKETITMIKMQHEENMMRLKIELKKTSH